MDNRCRSERHFRLPELYDDPEDSQGGGRDVVCLRRLILANSDVRLSYVVADSPSPLYSNGIGDEVVFIESGAAILESIFGRIEVRQGDNVVVPRVTIHRWIPVDVEKNGPRALCVEGSGHADDAVPATHNATVRAALGTADASYHLVEGATHYYVDQPDHLAECLQTLEDCPQERSLLP